MGRQSHIFLLVGAMCAVGAAAIVLMRRDDRYLIVERPDWMRQQSSNEEDLADAPVPLDAARLAVSGSAPSADDPLGEMLPAKDLGEALRGSGEGTVTFSASVLLGSELADEIASGVVDAAQRHWAGYQFLVKSGTQSPLRAQCDFFFAVWPSLGELLRTKTITPKIIAIPATSRVPRRAVTYFYSVATQQLDVVINTARWQVKLPFRDDDSNPERLLFSAMVEKVKERQ